MNGLMYYPSILFSILFLVLFPSNPPKIQRIWFFTQDQNLGINPPIASLNTNPGTLHTLFCYLELSKRQSMPIWKGAYYQNEFYSVEVIPINQDSLWVGRLKLNHKNFLIHRNPQNPMVELRFINPVPQSKNSSLTLIGEIHHSPFKIPIRDPIIELEPQNFQ